MRATLGLGLTVAIAIGALVDSYLQNVHGSAKGRKVTVFIHEGDTLDALVSRLVAARTIHSTLDFKIYLRLTTPPLLRPGIYYFRQNEAYSEILGVLRKGPSTIRLTIPEGFTLNQIAARIGDIVPTHKAVDFIQAATPSGTTSVSMLGSQPRSLEGLLYPDTYFVYPTESNRQLINTMLSRFNQVTSSIGLTLGTQVQGLSGYQVLIAASIVQRESVTSSDMVRVARVILNRLAIGMPLQMDSTVRYATSNLSEPITLSQLHSDSPYNTYVHVGLPPTPICSPGLAAIESVLHPANGSWLYFVALPGENHDSFFDQYIQQQAAIASAG